MKKLEEIKIEENNPTQTPQDLDHFQQLTERKEMRTFIINGAQQKKFVNNSIKTAKYNM